MYKTVPPWVYLPVCKTVPWVYLPPRREPLYYSRFTVGGQLLLPCAPLLSVAGLYAILARFTVGHAIPVSLVGMLSASFPVSLLAVSPVPARLTPLNVLKPENPARTKVTNFNLPNVRNPRLFPPRNTPGNNSHHRGDRLGTSNKPATESQCVQGM